MSFKLLSNEELIRQLELVIREAEIRVIEGDLQSFNVDAQYANGGVDWKASTASCYGPGHIDELDDPKPEWYSSTSNC